jgi:hypothetical protein
MTLFVFLPTLNDAIPYAVPEQFACDRLGEHLRRPFEHQTAGSDADHPVAIAAREIERVRVADDCDAEVLVDPQQRIHDHAGVGGVEGGDRLVGKDEIGLLDQRAGNGDALLLAAGQLIGPLRGEGSDAELLERRHGDRFVLLGPQVRERAPGRHGAETPH